MEIDRVSDRVHECWKERRTEGEELWQAMPKKPIRTAQNTRIRNGEDHFTSR